MVTPDGTRLTFGESANVEFAAPGKTPTRFHVRATGVEKAPSQDLEKFSAKARKDAGEIFHLR